MSRLVLRLIAVFLAGAALGCGLEPESGAAIRLVREISLPGIGCASPDGSIPGTLGPLAFDEATGRLFVVAPNENCVAVVDARTGKFIESLDGLPAPVAVGILPESHSISLTDGVQIDQKAEALVAVGCSGDDSIHAYSLEGLWGRYTTPIGGRPRTISRDGLVAYDLDDGTGGIACFEWSSKPKYNLRFPCRPQVIDMPPRKTAGGVGDTGPNFLIGLPRSDTKSPGGSLRDISSETGKVVRSNDLSSELGDPMLSDGGLFFAVRRQDSEIACLDYHGELSRARCVGDCRTMLHGTARRSVILVGGQSETSTRRSVDSRQLPGAVELFQADAAGLIKRVARVLTSPNARTAVRVGDNLLYVACPAHDRAGARLLVYSLAAAPAGE